MAWRNLINQVWRNKSYDGYLGRLHIRTHLSDQGIARGHGQFHLYVPVESSNAAYKSAQEKAKNDKGRMGALSSFRNIAANSFKNGVREQKTNERRWPGVRLVALSFLTGAVINIGVHHDRNKRVRRKPTEVVEPKPTMSNTKFSDVKGVDKAKSELQDMVRYLRDPKSMTECGAKVGKAVLLVGPPGTGKSMLARAVAGEAGVPFFYCDGGKLKECNYREMAALFSAAEKSCPCVIFIDRIDVGLARCPLYQPLLHYLDALKEEEENKGIIVIAAATSPDPMEKSLLNRGRFDRHILVPMPDVEARKHILQLHMEKVLMKSDDVDLNIIAQGTPGFSGADLVKLVNMATADGSKVVTMADMVKAKNKIMIMIMIRGDDDDDDA